MNRNTSNEIFRDYFVDRNEKSNTYRLVKFIKHKTRRNFKLMLYQKIGLFKKLRIAKGILSVKISILSIQLAKELFMLELEQSRFNFIHGEISQGKLPLSFRFYDPILI